MKTVMTIPETMPLSPVGDAAGENHESDGVVAPEE